MRPPVIVVSLVPKMEHVKPLIKKHGLGWDVLKNYRLVLNLSFVSKIVIKQIEGHLDKVMDALQSANQAMYLTETALMRI